MKSNHLGKNRNCLNLPLFLLIICLAVLRMNCEIKSSRNELTSFHWSSKFESGAATDFHLRRDGAIGFSIPEEPGGDVIEYPALTVPGEYLWFYFKVTSDGKEPLEFVVENAAGAHQTGLRWKITKPVFSIDGHTWVRAEYTQYSYLRHRIWKRGIKLFGKPVFRFRAPIIADTLWVAYSYPYTNSDLNMLIKEIQNSPEVTISTIGKSEEGRDILKVHINRSVSAVSKTNQQIWVVCREHPGETPASFVCEGMIHALLKHPAGKRLREVYGFSFIPILNVDGVAHGYYYHNANGVNLSFDWEEFRSIEARVLQEAIADDIKKGAMRMMINLHSCNDPTKGHFFLKISESELKPRDIEFQRGIFRVANRVHPQLQGHSPVRQWDLSSITGNALYRHNGVHCLYLECNYSRGADGSTVTPESLGETGAALVQALAEILTAE